MQWGQLANTATVTATVAEMTGNLPTSFTNINKCIAISEAHNVNGMENPSANVHCHLMSNQTIWIGAHIGGTGYLAYLKYIAVGV